MAPRDYVEKSEVTCVRKVRTRGLAEHGWNSPTRFALALSSCLLGWIQQQSEHSSPEAQSGSINRRYGDQNNQLEEAC